MLCPIVESSEAWFMETNGKIEIVETVLLLVYTYFETVK